jgi:hypothetical protein
MRAHQVGDFELLELVTGPVQLLVTGREQMQTADDRVHRAPWEFRRRIGQDVDNPGVPAPRQHHQALRGVKDQRLVFGYRVLDQAIRGLHLSLHTPITLRVLSRNRTREPCAGKNVRPIGVLDESPSCAFVRFSNRNHRIALAPGRRPAVEDSLCDVHHG